ncbi:MAG: hypothetical protein R3F59_29000 [Myxococcota bacterium]
MRRPLMRPATLLAALSLAAALAPSVALACDTGEKLRLSDEQKKLAARNAWAGVERQYELLQDTKCELSYDNFFLGAESARMLGKVYEQYERLRQALEVAPATDDNGNDPKPGLVDSLSGIESNYARVEIRGDARRRPVLSRPEMPFAPDQRKAVEWAQTYVAETGSFKGMLPFGKYVVGDVDFELAASPDWKIVEVGRGKGGTSTEEVTIADQVGGTTVQGAVRYASLVATAGPAYFLSPTTKKPVLLKSDGGHAFEPADVAVSGFAVELGGELGLTYDEPALGLAATLGYQGGFGTDTFNVVSGWVAGVARPGDLRLALGPMYQLSFGSGTGVADWFDRNHDPRIDPNDQIPYGGVGMGGGVKGAVGYGLLDLDPLQGIVEVGGAWQSDGSRNYYLFALRVGLVPSVPRFGG